MYYLGIDPSLTKTGLSLYIDSSNKIYIKGIGKDKDEKAKNFIDIYRISNSLVHSINSWFKQVSLDNSLGLFRLKIISELPPYGQFTSALLYTYDSMLFNRFQLDYKVDLICGVYPRYLTLVHGKGYPKSESTRKAKSILAELEEAHPDLMVDIDGRLNHDMAESFIFLCLLLYREGLFLDVLSKYEFFEYDKVMVIFEEE